MSFRVLGLAARLRPMLPRLRNVVVVRGEPEHGEVELGALVADRAKPPEPAVLDGPEPLVVMCGHDGRSEGRDPQP